ncbi:PA3371 family protein [Pseudomonas sp. UBA4194]|jgi:hypothetical protein|uniref:PA3371 family protein n=1 Tax=Pseudomonas sp. UBA4194 TaxID=1947317 RepID=UPI0025DA8D92|nr:PA3371 family protein [Pseudomonas sp. UBA4194]
MSRSAVTFLLFALCSWIGVMMMPVADLLDTTLKFVGAISLILFVLALIKGRKIKFDPLLR